MVGRRHFFIVLLISISFLSVFYFMTHHTKEVDLSPKEHSLTWLPHSSLRNTAASNSTNMYLRFLNMISPEHRMDKVSPDTKRELEDIIRSGKGLKPHSNERNEACWDENGVIFQPWRKPPASSMHKTHPSPYASEYETYIPFREDSFFEGRSPDLSYLTSPKIIMWGQPTRYTQPMSTPQLMRSCPEFPCRITTNLSYREKSAAMIFTAQIIKRPPPARKPDQVFVLHNHEPPVLNNGAWSPQFRTPQWQRAFNWTMTYRMDSDFIVPYGIVRKRPKLLEGKNYTSITREKKKMAAWLVSNCRATSNRHGYVKELQKYINVDIYGQCGTFKCPHEKDDQCAEIIAKQYKFYIAFESSFCSDYITEKLFHYLTMDTILVARGENQYYKHLPSEIFINTADYPSPKELADRLKYLDENDEAYTNMLREKDKYFSIVEGYPVRNGDGSIRFMAYRFESVSLCLMCQRLWNLDKYSKSVSNIHQWFDSKLCYVPKKTI